MVNCLRGGCYQGLDHEVVARRVLRERQSSSSLLLLRTLTCVLFVFLARVLVSKIEVVHFGALKQLRHDGVLVLSEKLVAVLDRGAAGRSVYDVDGVNVLMVVLVQ